MHTTESSFGDGGFPGSIQEEKNEPWLNWHSEHHLWRQGNIVVKELHLLLLPLKKDLILQRGKQKPE